MPFVYLIIIGAAAGFLATRVMRLDTDIPTTVAIGVFGALIGGLLLRFLIVGAGRGGGFCRCVLRGTGADLAVADLQALNTGTAAQVRRLTASFSRKPSPPHSNWPCQAANRIAGGLARLFALADAQRQGGFHHLPPAGRKGAAFVIGGDAQQAGDRRCHGVQRLQADPAGLFRQWRPWRWWSPRSGPASRWRKAAARIAGDRAEALGKGRGRKPGGAGDGAKADGLVAACRQKLADRGVNLFVGNGLLCGTSQNT